MQTSVSMTTQLVSSALVLFLVSSCLTWVVRRDASQRVASFLLWSGGVVMLVGAILGWNSVATWTFSVPFSLGCAQFACRVDSLSVIFIGLLGTITVAVALSHRDMSLI